MSAYKTKLIDSARTDFGAILGRCLQAMDVPYERLAEKINVKSTYLSAIISGRQSVSKKWIANKGIFAALKSLDTSKNKKIFREFEPALQSAVNSIKNNSSKKINENRDDFGAVLGRCLQAMDMHYLQFAEHIDIFLTTLSGVISGKILPTKQWVTNKRIFETLELLNPDVYRQFETQFLMAYSNLNNGIKIKCSNIEKKFETLLPNETNPFEITPTFFAAVRDYIQHQKVKNNCTEQNLRDKFRGAACVLDIKFKFISAAVAGFIDSNPISQPESLPTEDVTGKILLIASEAFNEYSARDKIYEGFSHLPAIQREEQQQRLG